MSDSPDINPWRTLSSNQVYVNPWIQVEHREVIAPTGKPGIYGVVHMKNKAVGIVPVDDQGYTWLVGQYRYATEGYSWEIPMGGAPHDEWTADAARRELQEETGLVADELSELMRLHTSNCVTDEQGVVYVARKLTQVGWNPDETEELKVRRLPLQEAVDMALSGAITDAISVAALLKIALQHPDWLTRNE
ncbi:NUDIX hydrolase [Hahella sp. HN01]|uniref:NUDIX domain-containing protein n=1 Tax=Hahella sp. HN01 TaxID=2847262 RepID=UPI001C1EA114|nr:NUDIX hydrolase [Hahella sp. HN01]MBU6952976.1 NUDIX hydrolase [Hahella sp. HN01]